MVLRKKCKLENEDIYSLSTFIPKQNLIIAKLKIVAFEEHITSAKSHPNQPHILVIHGPTGCGKTTLVTSIVAFHSMTLVKVDEMIDLDHQDSSDFPGKEYLSTACQRHANFPALNIISKNGNNMKDNTKVLFIDDLEGVGDDALTRLGKSLLTVQRGIYVMTCTDWFSVCKRVKCFKEMEIKEVALNPIAPTFIQKAINQRFSNATDIPKYLIESGDIRSCIMFMHMHSMDQKQSEKDTNLTLFHALGRLFYPLKDRHNLWDPYLPEDRFIFHYYIHHNMLPYMHDLREACLVLDALSTDSYEHNNSPFVEYTLSVLINQDDRNVVRRRPLFSRPDYLEIFKKH